MRLDLFSFLTVSVYHQAIARPEIAPENPFFIHASSSAELGRRGEISSRASPGDFVVAPDTPAAAVSNSRSDLSSQPQPNDPSGQYETLLSAAGSIEISLTGSDNGCSPSSGHKFRKRQGCAGKSKDDPAHGDDDLVPTNSPTEPESGCSPSSGRKLRKRQYCGRNSGSDQPQDDSSSSDEERLCPRNRRTLCCKGPRPSGIYTQGCSDFTTIFDPRCTVWKINCCVYYISNAKPGSDIHILLSDEGVGVFCYTPLFFPIQ